MTTFIPNNLELLSPNVLLNPPDGTHFALLYDTAEEKNALIAQFINEGLARGDICAYGTVRCRVPGHLETMSSLIKDYDRHVKEGSLIIIDFAPFYMAAMMGNFEPFVEAKNLLDEKVRERSQEGNTKKQLRIIGDAVELMFDNDEFDPCAALEGWWQGIFEGGVTLCTYKRSSIRSNYHDIQFHRAVKSTHDYVVDAKEISNVQASEKYLEQVHLPNPVLPETLNSDEGVKIMTDEGRQN